MFLDHREKTNKEEINILDIGKRLEKGVLLSFWVKKGE